MLWPSHNWLTKAEKNWNKSPQDVGMGLMMRETKPSLHPILERPWKWRLQKVQKVGFKTKLGEIFVSPFVNSSPSAQKMGTSLSTENKARDTRHSWGLSKFLYNESLHAEWGAPGPFPCWALRLQQPNIHLPDQKLEESSLEKLAEG